MKFLPKIVLVMTAAVSCAAGAATPLSPQADQERRDRNREEALAAYHASPEGRSYGSNASYSSNSGYRDDSVKGKVKHAEDTVVTKTKHAGHTVATETRKATKPVRDFTHRQLNKSRDFEARQNQKYGKASAQADHGDAIK
jgi:Ni/Co efflux regulator RcnB